MLKEDIRLILDEFSPDALFRHTKTIGEKWAGRLSGTKVLDEGAAKYIVDELRSYGLDNATLQEFDGLLSIPTHSELYVIRPHKKLIRSMAFAHIGSTTDEGIEAELVFVHSGGFQDYEGKDVKGKIVMAELSLDPPRPEKVRIATMKGAAAVVLSNWGPSDSEIVPFGTAKSVWGNPTPDNIAMLDVVPALGISRKDGEYLMQLCEAGPVSVRLIAQATREWRKTCQPWARLEGTSNADKFVIVGGHLDSWVQGITDNASGNALMLELARVLSKHRDKLSRSVEFVFWVGHENGILEGSTWYVDNAWERLNRNGLLYINVDQPGMKGTSRYVVFSSPETVRWHTGIDKELVKQVKCERIPLTKVSDESFFGVGIPSLWGLSLYSLEDVKNWHGAIVGPYLHSEHDTIERLDVDLLTETLRTITAYAFDVCTRLILPFEYETVAEVFITQLQDYQEVGGKHLDLNILIESAKELKIKAKGLDGYARSLEARFEFAKQKEKNQIETCADTVNRCLMRLARILTPVRSQVSDRYDQDTYGLSTLHKPIPVLHEIDQLKKLDPNGQAYKLLITKLIRQRNRVQDALSDAIWHIDNTMRLLGIQ